MPTRPVPSVSYQNPAAPVSATEVPYYPSGTSSEPARYSNPADRCGAGELQWLVGRQRTEIPVPVDVTSRRVTCTTCAVTEDHNESRLNIFYDRQTGRVESVRCG